MTSATLGIANIQRGQNYLSRSCRIWKYLSTDKKAIYNGRSFAQKYNWLKRKSEKHNYIFVPETGDINPASKGSFAVTSVLCTLAVPKFILSDFCNFYTIWHHTLKLKKKF